jgi:hypothetical protein
VRQAALADEAAVQLLDGAGRLGHLALAELARRPARQLEQGARAREQRRDTAEEIVVGSHSAESNRQRFTGRMGGGESAFFTRMKERRILYSPQS